MPTARRFCPMRCSATDESIDAAARSATPAGRPSSQRPIHPVVAAPPPKRPKLTRRESTWVTYAAWSNFVIAWDVVWRQEQGAADEEAARARAAAKAEVAKQKRRSRGLKGVPLSPVLAKLVSCAEIDSVLVVCRAGSNA